MYLQWVGTSHRVSLVDVHTSNGVKLSSWSEPQNFGTILFIINSNINSETPYFGTLEKTLPKRMVFNMSMC